MQIGILEVDLLILKSRSLKEKRMALRSLKDKLRQKFNISIVELGDLDKWQSTTIALVYASLKKRRCNEVLSNILNFIENFRSVQIRDYRMEFV